MPGLLQRGAQFGHALATACSAFSATAGSFPASNTIWSRQRDDVSLDQMQKFWDELPVEVRHELLRIDKQTFCEQARKNLYCSRCHGLLLECYSQILVYGKSLQHEFYGRCCTRKTTAEVFAVDESDNLQDPSVHPWGGLATTKDGILTLLDCFICASSLDVLHKVFDSSRRREHDRELLYPDACGGGGRGWISQGLINYGRGHGTREACALHTSRLSCDTLVDFWSALADETRSSLLHMKEDDFIERLMYRFDSKRFCRDCRRNVLREFKELKELKRLRKELRCSSWFCVADTAIQYEVSEDSVVADWQYSFEDTSTYHHFEWAIGTEEGKTDILDFEDAGMNGKVQVNGLDLSNLSACFITLRAWKLDGRCTELCVKAHALKGQACVHQRLIVGDGFVSITKGNSVKSFFEHAEEVEEEEDDDSVDKDGIELDGDGSRSQKHAKSPELAREFLLDAATVIFKEQVEKAFREGTARQNAHSLFVSLSMKLLEERVHVACKEIITLEKQIKLLEEEENEKREEEERREKRRNKEREKKLRRKERLKEKEKDREIKLIEAKPRSIDLSTSTNNSSTIINDESATSIHNSSDSAKDNNTLLEPVFANMTDYNSSNGYADTKNQQGDRPCHEGYADEFRESIGSFIPKQSKSSRRKLTFERVTVEDQATRCYDKHKSTFSSEMIQHVSSMKLKASSRSLSGGPRSFKERVVRLNSRNCIDARFSEKFHSSKTYDYQSYLSNQSGEYRVKDRSHISIIRDSREVKSANAADSSGDWPRQRSRYSKHNHGIPDNCFFPKGGRDVIHTRQVWEPLDVRKKENRNNLGSDTTLSFAAKVHPSEEISYDKDEKGCQRNDTSAEDCSSELSRNAGKVDSISFCESHLDSSKDSSKSDSRTSSRCQNEFIPSERPLCCSKDIADGHNPSSIMSTFSISNSCHSVVNSSSSDSCSSCPSEGDSSTNLSSTLNVETSSTSDSEYASQQFDGRDFSSCNGDAFPRNQNNSLDSKFAARGDASHNVTTLFPLGSCTGASFQREESWKVGYNSVGGVSKVDVSLPQQNMLQVHNNNLTMPTFPSEIMCYENQNAFSWSATAINGLLPFSQHSPYMFPPPVGYGQPANRSSEFGMQYNTMQPPMTAAVFNLQQHHLYHANSRDCRFYPTSPKVQVRNDNNVHGVEQVIEVPEPREKLSENKVPPLNEGTNKSSSKAHEGNQSFSLFHFGGPLVGAAAYDVKLEYEKEHTGPTLKSVESQDSIACSIENTKVEEYSLFSTGNSSKFLFSTFTL